MSVMVAERPETEQTEQTESPVRTPIRRRTFPRVDNPALVAVPQHKHLPGWVRKLHGQARGPLGDLLVLLEEEPRGKLQTRITALTEAIERGKFSAAFKYQELIAEGSDMWDEQQKGRIQADQVKREVADKQRNLEKDLRNAEGVLPQDVLSRYRKAFKQADGAEAIEGVSKEFDHAYRSATENKQKQRQREIDRTKKMISSVPKAQVVERMESWQDVLRKFAEEQGQ